jgi:hypothetical protein
MKLKQKQKDEMDNEESDLSRLFPRTILLFTATGRLPVAAASLFKR